MILKENYVANSGEDVTVKERISMKLKSDIDHGISKEANKTKTNKHLFLHLGPKNYGI